MRGSGFPPLYAFAPCADDGTNPTLPSLSRRSGYDGTMWRRFGHLFLNAPLHVSQLSDKLQAGVRCNFMPGA
jgi:hypothetical protein